MFKTKMKKYGNAAISKYAKNPYHIEKESNKQRLPLWARISIPSILVTAGVVVALVIANSFVKPIDPFKKHAMNQTKKLFNLEHQELSDSFVNSIKNFSSDYYNSSFNFYCKGPLSRGKSAQNFIFSPMSIATNLYALYDGSAGETQKRLSSVLHLDETFDHLSEMKKAISNNTMNYVNEENGKHLYSEISSALFIDSAFSNSIEKDFVNTLTDYYYTDIYQGQLTSEEMINLMADYINKKTHSFFDAKPINDEFKFDGDIKLVNTSYFEANWASQFLECKKPILFNNLDGSTNEINCLYTELESYIYTNDGYDLVSIGLNKKYLFNVLLPKANNNIENISVNDLLSKTYKEKYQARINVYLPEFTLIHSSWPLNRLDLDFDGANFTKISSNKQIVIEDIGHLAGINVDVNGVTGGSVTENGHVVPIVYNVLPTFDFVIDRPFIYSITNQDEIPLFVGLIQNL